MIHDMDKRYQKMARMKSLLFDFISYIHFHKWETIFEAPFYADDRAMKPMGIISHQRCSKCGKIREVIR